VRIFGLQEIATALLKSEGISEGLWRVGLHLNFAGAFHQWNETSSPDSVAWLPTAYVGVTGIGIEPSAQPGPMVFDAAVLNPSVAKRTGKKKTPSA